MPSPSTHPLVPSTLFVDFATEPARYRHWRLSVEPPVATLTMAVAADAGMGGYYELKLNSYDLGVDIELYDAVQRLRFEYPEVKVVVVTGGVDKVFCAGANIQMLAGSSHEHKVNFCKFTNETRNAIEQATAESGQAWIAAVNGTAAGGGYELALACDEILLVDDRASSVSLPEVPLLAVLPGTGGLTRVVDKRHVRRDLADAFATRAEGLRGKTALAWNLVDHVAPPSEFADLLAERVAARAARSDRPGSGPGIRLDPLDRSTGENERSYRHVSVVIDRNLGTATITVTGPTEPQPSSVEELVAAGPTSWVLAAARELDDALLHLRFNETTVGSWVLRTEGSAEAVARAEAVLARPISVAAATGGGEQGDGDDHWLAREIRLMWARTMKRLDLSSRSLVALVEPGSCFAGMLAELALAADQSFMLDGVWEDGGADRDIDLAPARLRLTSANDGWYPMASGISRLRARFWGRDDALEAALAVTGEDLLAAEANAVELVTFVPDDIDWDDEIRVMLEERNSFSPDALTAMEANYRFVGPETMETKIFARLSAWQNWVFQRPNAAGPDGALHRYGTGSRPQYDQARV